MQTITTALWALAIGLILMFGIDMLGYAIDSKTVHKKKPYEYKDICKLFTAYPDWYIATLKESRKWGVPPSTVMAIIHQESHFRQHARPPKHGEGHLLPSSAYGYAQAIMSTWHIYQEETGNKEGHRDNFTDAVDFIGWYADQASKRLGIQKSNAYELYLAYFEGISGYYHRAFLKQMWLRVIAHKVQSLAWLYKTELADCPTLPDTDIIEKGRKLEQLSPIDLFKTLPDKSWWRI